MSDAENFDKLNSLVGGTPRETTATGGAPRRTRDWSDSIASYIGKHPELSLGIALALGAGIALLLKRR